MNGGLHLTPIGSVSAARGRIVSAVDFDHFAGLILHYVGAGHEITVAQAHFASGRQPIKLFGRILAKVVLLDVEHTRKRHFTRAGARVLGIVDGVHLLDIVFGIVVDHNLQRPQHGHHAWRTLIQILAQKMFEHRELDGAIGLGYSGGVAEIA